MAIRNRKNNNKYFIDITFNRKRYRLASPANTPSGAKAYERVVLGKLARGEVIKEPEEKEVVDEMPTFGKFALEFVESYSKSNNRLSEYKNKLNILKVHLLPWFGDIPIDKISGRDIESFKMEKMKTDLSPKTINNHLIVLSKILHVANEWEITDRIPKIKKMKTTTKKIDFLTEEELQLLLANSKGVLRDLILTAVRTGLRWGELSALQWENVNLSGVEPNIAIIESIYEGIIGPTKSGKARYIPLVKEVQQTLINRQRPNGFVFADRNGKFLVHTTYLNQLKSICQKAGLRKIGWHTLRHTFASHLAMKGIPIIALKELMGHSSITTTMIYAHLSHSTLIESIKLLEKPESNILGAMWAPTILTTSEMSADNKKCL